MEDEGQTEVTWPPVFASTDAKPLLKHVKPSRANYMPRTYKLIEDDESSSDLCACNNTNSSIAIKNINDTPAKSDPETKPYLKASQNDEKSVGGNSALKGKGMSASIQISMEPVESLSPKRAPKKTVDSINSADIGLDRENAIRFDENDLFTSRNDSDKTKIISANIDNDEAPKRPRGRPRGSFKRRHRNLCNDIPDSTDTRLQSSADTFHKSTIPSSGSPQKRIKTTPTRDNKVMLPRLKDQEDGSTSDTPTSDNVSERDNTEHQCNICNKKFSSQARLQNHMHWHVQTKMFRCNVCKKIFKRFGNFIRHQQLHSKNKTDKTTTKSPQSRARNIPKASDKKTNIEKAHKCKICKRTFAYLGRLKIHLLTHESQKRYRCHVCSKEFVNFGWLKHHAERSHNLTSLKRCEVRIQGSKSHAQKKAFNSLHRPQMSRAPKPTRVRQLCKQNNKSNRDSRDIINHATGEYRCGICNKQFTLRGTLTSHRIVHTGESPFQCHICNKPMRWRKQLIQHCVNVHGEYMPYKCDVCGLLFKFSMLLRKHKETHPQIKPEPSLKPTSSHPKSEDIQDNADNLHKCDKCDRTFRSIHGVRRHSASHRESQPTSRQTPPRQTTSRRQSGRLRVSRSPPKPQDPSPTHQKSYKCSNEFELKTDDKKAHQNKIQSTPNTEPGKKNWIKFTRENGEHVYRCGLCTNSDRRFAAVSSVRKHVGMVHRDFTENLVEPDGLYDDLPEQPYTSNQCNNGATTKTSTLSTSVGDEPSSTLQSSNLPKNCTCSGRGRAFVYKNNRLTHLPNNCPVHNKESSESKKILKGNQILKCKHCNEEFDGLAREKFQEHELSHELKATEPTGMTYACFECEVEFAMVNELMDHYENDH